MSNFNFTKIVFFFNYTHSRKRINKSIKNRENAKTAPLIHSLIYLWVYMRFYRFEKERPIKQPIRQKHGQGEVERVRKERRL